ncbi:MAG: DASS family sodium-coupled anion symporter [Oscillospiraceae bacterium]|nr:DASS family sodium-coupled anion symporter [Oscillospiraceae bacterium]
MTKEKSRTLLTQHGVSIRQAAIILGIIAVYFIITAFQPPEGLTPSGLKAIALMVCVVLTWATQVVPIIVSSVFFIFLIGAMGLAKPELILDPITGLLVSDPITETMVIKDFASHVIFFMFVSILLAYAMDRCGMNQRLALKMTALSKGSPKAMVLLFMAGTGIVSMIISNVPSCAAFLPIVLAVCKKNDCIKGKSNFAKASIIGIIFAAMVGGNATPAGSPINIMALDLLKRGTGLDISFAQWSLMGIPLVLLIIPVLWLILITVFPPEFKKLAGLEDSKEELAKLGKLNTQEWKFIAIVLVMLFFWFTNPYLHKISTTAVLAFAAAILFFPGVRLLDYDYVKQKLDWTVIIMTGASIAFAATMLSTGASQWIADMTLMRFANVHPVVLVFVIAIFTTLIHLLIPSCPALVGVLVPTVISFAAKAEMPAMMLFLPVAFNVSTYWLLPFDPLPMMCFPEKYFSIKDFFKAGLPAHIALILVSVGIVMFFGKPLGFF